MWPDAKPKKKPADSAGQSQEAEAEDEIAAIIAASRAAVDRPAAASTSAMLPSQHCLQAFSFSPATWILRAELGMDGMDAPESLVVQILSLSKGLVRLSLYLDMVGVSMTRYDREKKTQWIP
eukprot:symbB.v1.2.006200.t1/scaffold355.1/size243294/10